MLENRIVIENNGCSKLMTPNMARVRNSTYISRLLLILIVLSR